MRENTGSIMSSRQDQQEQRLQELISTLNRLSSELLTLVNSRPTQEDPPVRYDLPETSGWASTTQAESWPK